MKFFIRFGSYALGSCVFGAAIHQTAAIKRSCFADPRVWNYNWDEMADRPNVGIRNILLIRHGQYNTDGETDAARKLTQLGERQAEVLGQYIGKMSNAIAVPITKIYCSSMTRAKQTCNIARSNFGIDSPAPQFTSALIEGPPHVFDPPHPTYNPSEREITQCGQRLNRAFSKYFHRATTDRSTFEIFFCHANVTRYFLCKALQLPLNSWLRFNLRHCSITWIIIQEDGKVLCQTFGDTGFMNNALRTDN